MRQMLTTIRKYSWGDRLKLAFEACLIGMGAVFLIAALVAMVWSGVGAVGALL